MEYRSHCYMKNDCLCGYAKNNTQNCYQKECSSYINREIKCAQIEFEHDIKTAQERYLKRINKVLKKE